MRINMQSISHQDKLRLIFSEACRLFELNGYQIRAMKRVVDERGRGVLNLKKSYTLAHINLKKKIITIDIYTPRFRKPKAINSILRILAHEIAHIQKPPFRQRHRGRIIARQHYPAFYEQANKNYEKLARSVNDWL